ncbi:MAG: acyl carrier protein [Actinomycetota bacterium]|nr:acyl carrier protein [Actinomycetota bacterium]
MDRDSAYETFRNCVAEVLDIDPALVTPEARWDKDLNADSLAVIEITLALNEAFSVKLPDFEPGDVQTAGDAFEVVAQTAGI